MAYRAAGQFDRAIEHLTSLTKLEPNYVRTYRYLARIYESKGMFEEALNQEEKVALLEGDDLAEFGKGKQELLAAYRATGASGYWGKLLEWANEDLARGRPVDAEYMAYLHARLGEKDQAFQWIEKVFEDREEGRQGFGIAMGWDNLRGDSRFADVLRRIKWPESK
jgi:tetratricopeptide (TPR) repeat protein